MKSILFIFSKLRFYIEIFLDSVLIDKSNFTHQKACLINWNYEPYNIIV